MDQNLMVGLMMLAGTFGAGHIVGWWRRGAGS